MFSTTTHENVDNPENTEAEQVYYDRIRDFLLHGILLWQAVNSISDRAIQNLLQFLKSCLKAIAQLSGCQALVDMFEATSFTLYSIRNYLDIDRENFDTHIVCHKCHTLYKIEEPQTQKTCSNIVWPNHPSANKRAPCGAKLYEEVTDRPKKIYTCASIKSYLEFFVKSPKFVDWCNEWRVRSVPDNYITDIYDGNIWKMYEANGYFSSRYNLMIMLNVDWLQPYKHSPYSLGAVYAVILNLPRKIRFKDDYVMLLALIPGPKEPSKDINTYMTPIIEELLQFDQGLLINDTSVYGNIYRVRLMGTSSDIPATRKLGGFVGHGANKGIYQIISY